MEKNLTTGNVWKTVLCFSLPYLLSYFLQTLYGMADLFMIGQFNGAESTTAVAVGSQVMHMLTVMIVGLAMGATVMIGQSTGAKKQKQASLAIGNTVTLFMTLSIILTAGLLFALKPIVTVMSTPDEAIAGTISYLTICFIGIPFITAYNIICSIFRGMGDSKSPMYFIAAACAANIVLDYLLIGKMGLGPAGAALGTTLSQTISVIISLFIILKRKTEITLAKEYFIPDKKTMAGLLKIGIPIALQDGFIQISFLVITVFANQRGLNDAAAVGIVEKIIGILFLVPSSMLQTVSALCAQNIGAGKHKRARLTLRYALLITVTWGIAACLLMQFYAEPFIRLFAKTMTLLCCLEASIYGATSGTASLPEFTLVSAVISVHTDYPESHFFTISFRLSVSAFRFPTWRQTILQIRCFRWDLPLLLALRFRFSSAWACFFGCGFRVPNYNMVYTPYLRTH